jgi:hypothetical protein
MACLLIPVVIAVLAFANRAIVRQFLGRQAGTGWWFALIGAWFVGAAVGVWSSFFFEYPLSPKTRILGAPVPMGAFHLEGPPGKEQWADYINPNAHLALSSNVILIALLAPFPVSLAFWLGTRQTKRQVEASG